MKIAWVDFPDMWYWRSGTIWTMEIEGYEVHKLDWWNKETNAVDVRRVLDKCVEIGIEVVLLHFGQIPVKEANETIVLFKEVGIKVIAFSPVRGILKGADLVTTVDRKPSYLIEDIELLRGDPG